MVGDLHGTTALHTQVEDAFHHISGYRVNHPAAGVLQVFYIAIGHIGGQGYASLTLGFLDGSDLAAGVPGIELVSQPRIKNDALCLDITDEIVVDVNVAFFVIVHGIAFADLNFLNQANQRGTV